MRTDKILITGAGGQLGTVLTTQLQQKHGFQNVIASDLRRNSSFEGNFEVLDVTDFDALKRCVLKNEITQIYHLVAILSAKGE
ncbi:MAG: threonine 3-dehydrogenase, partial [Arenicella sp.]